MNAIQRNGIDTAEVKPYAWAIWTNQKTPVEILSYPSPNEGAEDTIMIRTLPGDPTSLVEVPLSEIAAFDPQTHAWAKRERVYYSDNPTAFHFADTLKAARERKGTLRETADYLKRYDPEAEREHGPKGDLEVYYREGNEADEIHLTTDEREDFERLHDLDLTADVIPSEQFDALVLHLFCTCNLQKGTEHEGYHHPECEEFNGHN